MAAKPANGSPTGCLRQQDRHGWFVDDILSVNDIDPRQLLPYSLRLGMLECLSQPCRSLGEKGESGA